ncbi:MAG: undecaprenyldiphospho-muramoylpentapeptide beta-N-acetylglucosaminyltransferase [Bacteroidales bacterium]|nr:undecaprenyldiphospho-muramoylpentapeptide beta-N-acetylglucosaminyltransferase [Bacteroidales bacterium]
MKQKKALRVIIAGGGTGGHVFPAIAIARALQKKASDARILFVGAKGRMEMTKVPQAGYHIIGLNIAGLQRRLSWQNLSLPWKLIQSLAGAATIIKRFKPDLVIGVGGYASGPVVWAAHRQKIPVLIQEQNSFPGLTNRMLGKKAAKICVAYEGMDQYFSKEKLYITGNPVREEMLMLDGKSTEAMNHFRLKAGRPVLLVTGGSLGALTINESMALHLEELLNKGVQVIWQTGKSYYARAQELKKALKADESLIVNEFILRMDLAYAAADLVVSRAGAIAIAEICISGKPAILIPSPFVAEDHQTKNALALVNHQAAVMLKDAEAREKLGQTITGLIFDEDKKQKMKVKLAGMAHRNAADAIAGVAISMLPDK